MNLTIQVDETKFKDVVEKELAAFSHDELHDILLEAIKKYLTEDKVIQGLFIKENHNSYSYSSSYITYEPTALLTDIAKRVDLSQTAEDITQKMKDAITNDMTGVVTKLFSTLISNALIDQWKAKGDLESIIYSIAHQVMNNNRN